MRNVFFVLVFLSSIFCFSKDYVDWSIIPNAAAVVTLLSVITAVILACKERLVFSLSTISVLLLAIILYFVDNQNIYSIYIFVFGIVTLFLFLSSNTSSRFFSLRQISRLLPIILAFEAICGIVQFIQIGESLQVCGHFDNPIGFALALSFAIPFLLYTIEEDTRFFSLLAKGLLSLIFIALLFSASRAVILSSFLLIVLYHAQTVVSYWKRLPIVCRLICCLFVFFAIVLLYFLKQDSANGRLLIWGTSCVMIIDCPWGFGVGGVAREYMNYQAEFLSNFHSDYWLNLSDNITRVFNEYLSVGIELGMIPMLLLLMAFVYLLRRILKETDKHNKICLLLLFSISFTSFFSYPLYYPVSWVVIGYSISCLLNPNKYTITIRNAFLPCYFVILFIVSVLLYQRQELRYQRKWYVSAQAALNGEQGVLFTDYSWLYEYLREYPNFLYNYGAELNYAGEYNLSNKVLKEYLTQKADYDAWLLMADNFQRMNQYADAMISFQKAAAMCPGRIYPLYAQMLLFQYLDEMDKAQNVARQIVNKNVKILSSDVQRMVQHAERLLCSIQK